jgi:citrate lyase beta subunit
MADTPGARPDPGSPQPGPGPHPHVDHELLAALDQLLEHADALVAHTPPAVTGTRRPVHTVYVPAGAAEPELAADWGRRAAALLAGPAGDGLAEACEVDPDAAAALLPMVAAKLEQEPIEDLRLDFEDGYPPVDDPAEDADATRAGELLAAFATGKAPAAPPFFGIRIGSMEAATRRRALHTLELVLDALLTGAGELPHGFVITLPKVGHPAQVQALVLVCRRLEAAYGLVRGALRFELQIELPRAVLGPDGTATVTKLVAAAGGRCSGLHFGTYDYTAALGIAAPYQAADHPAAEHAKQVMLLAGAQAGIPVSDGSSALLPVGHTGQVHAAWREHARLVTRALRRGLYQGWDLHPGQLPSRYLATYACYARSAPAMADRLGAYLARTRAADPADAAPEVADEPATARALAGFLLRAVHCGAVDPGAVQARSSVTPADLADLAAAR